MFMLFFKVLILFVFFLKFIVKSVSVYFGNFLRLYLDVGMR